jgi:hypothetical protein
MAKLDSVHESKCRMLVKMVSAGEETRRLNLPLPKDAGRLIRSKLCGSCTTLATTFLDVSFWAGSGGGGYR